MTGDRSYGSPGAFRRALTDKLRDLAGRSRWTLQQLQRQMATTGCWNAFTSSMRAGSSKARPRCSPATSVSGRLSTLTSTTR
jgi:hypothetical protein